LRLGQETVERLERRLAVKIPEMRLDRRFREVTVETIARALPHDSALIEFVRYAEHSFGRMQRGLRLPVCRPPRYAAIVLPGGEASGLRLIDLGRATRVEAAVRRLRAVIVKNAAVPDLGPGKRLRRLIFDPLVKALGARRHIVVAPDGALNHVPFEALPAAAGDSRYLIDDYEITYLATGRDMLRFGRQRPSSLRPSVVIADPDFNLRSPGRAPSPTASAPRPRRAPPGARST